MTQFGRILLFLAIGAKIPGIAAAAYSPDVPLHESDSPGAGPADLPITRLSVGLEAIA